MYLSKLFLLRNIFFVLAVFIYFAIPSLINANDEIIVQVMSVQNEQAAKNEVNRLMELGTPSFQRLENIPGNGSWHRVYIGPFETDSEAKAVAVHLKNEGIITEYIIRKPTNVSAPTAATLPDGYAAYDEQSSQPPVIINPDGSQSVYPKTEDYPVAAYAENEPAPVYPVTEKKTSNKMVAAKPRGDMKLESFTFLVDLSSSMRKLSACQGKIKEEAVYTLLRKMNHRIPSHPYEAALRVYGYKQAWNRMDYTKLYYGPSLYERNSYEDALAQLTAADSISPFGWAMDAVREELNIMPGRKVVLMFADFEENTDSGGPVEKAKSLIKSYGPNLKIYTFYITRQVSGEKLAAKIAAAGLGKSYDICQLLSSEQAFENMMNEIFGPSDEPACSDQDEDGVCDDRDKCPNTPKGAPVDERGCWIAAYSQFFDFDKDVVKSAFHPRLKHAAELVINNPQLGVISIAGHTDSKGTDAYNMDLGLRRAEAVKNLMIKFGVPADRMVVESFGKSRPVADNSTEEGRAKNRRVEFHVGDIPAN